MSERSDNRVKSLSDVASAIDYVNSRGEGDGNCNGKSDNDSDDS